MIGGYSELAKSLPLHAYQREAVQWMFDRLFTEDRPGCGLFLDPGLGKTRITLSLVDLLFQMGEIKRVLILAPLRPAYNVWPLELKKWGFPYSHMILHRQHAAAMAWGLKVEICNYDSLSKLQNVENRWDMLVLDESTFVKTFSTNRAKFLRKMIKTIPKRVILTGTPAANSLQDLFSQQFLIDNGVALGTSLGQFRATFCTAGGGWQGRGWSVRKSAAAEIKSRIGATVLRMQAEDYLDMPELVHNDIWVSIPPHIMREYKRLKRELLAELEGGDVTAVSAGAAYIKCRQFANGAAYEMGEDGNPIQKGADKVHITIHNEKIDAIRELYSELSGKPLLVFYTFQHDLARLKQVREFKGYGVINGQTKSKDLAKICADWNSGKTPLLFCQWQAASHGLNLQEGPCEDMACFGLTDSLETFEQAFRRVYRQGVAARQVRIHKILAIDTVDSVQRDRLSGKHATQAELMEALKRHARD